ncbi:MAG: hypothetical protein AB2805_17790 [Candidatus Thiodiazotropha sp.]
MIVERSNTHQADTDKQNKPGPMAGACMVFQAECDANRTDEQEGQVGDDIEKIGDTQCAELNRQEIGGENPLPGKV